MDLDKIPERIKAKIDFEGPGGCWVWLGYKDKDGYGETTIREIGKPKRKGRFHRIFYETKYGIIPPHFQIDHLCRNRACVNPLHMEIVTVQENVRRGYSPSAINSRKTHCKAGHEFNTINTLFGKKGNKNQRICRVCGKLRMREIRHKKREGETA